MRWSRRDDAEATDSLEVPTIAGDDTETVRESGRRDPEVVRARNVAAAGQACPHLGVTRATGSVIGTGSKPASTCSTNARRRLRRAICNQVGFDNGRQGQKPETIANTESQQPA